MRSITLQLGAFMTGSSQAEAPVVLLVLDGWGWREAREGNAIAMARTPNWDRLIASAPRTIPSSFERINLAVDTSA